MRRRSARCGVRDNEVNAMTDETMGTVLQNCPVCGAPVAADATACEACGFKLLGRTQAFKPLNMQAQASPAMANPALLSEATLKIVKGRKSAAHSAWRPIVLPWAAVRSATSS